MSKREGPCYDGGRHRWLTVTRQGTVGEPPVEGPGAWSSIYWRCSRCGQKTTRNPR